MFTRREFLGLTAGAGTTLALTPELLRALKALQQPSGRLIQRAIPSTGEMLPIISFGPQQESDAAGMKELLNALVNGGGKVVDGVHGGGEGIARAAAAELGTQEQFFWTTTVRSPAPRSPGSPPPPKADAAVVRADIEKKLAAYKTPRLDLVMVSAYAAFHDPTYLTVLREMKQEGRVRYIGVEHLAFPRNFPTPPFFELEPVMRNEGLDFVATDYSVSDRRAEDTILPLAKERKMGFLAYFAFDRGRGLKRVANTPLPEWASEFDARSWSQFFLKYVVSHPTVVAARVGTTKTAHMLDNLGGGSGRLPNDAMRKRMAQFVDSLPG